MKKDSEFTQENLFVVITTEDNSWKVHGIIGTRKDAEEYARILNGSMLPVTSLKDLRGNTEDEETVPAGSGRDAMQPDEYQFSSEDSDRVTVMKCIAKGYSVREMAARIGKSIGTVQMHLRELEEKGLVGNRTSPEGKRLARARYLTEKGKVMLGCSASELVRQKGGKN